jgi:membrane-bound serine protease (ClpP class)
MTVRGRGFESRPRDGRARAGASVVPLLLRLLAGVSLGLFGALTAFAQDGGAVAASAGLWDRAAHVIVQPWTTIGLLVAGCLLLYHDLLTPKTWGLTGTLGVIAVGLVFAAQITIGDVGWVGVLLLLAGLAAILIEIHVFPGRGSALGGFVLLYAGMFLSLGGTKNAVFALSVTTFLILVTGIAFLAYLPKSPAWQKESQRIQQKQAVLGDLLERPVIHPGQIGTALIALRPTGTADFRGVQVQVVTEGDFLEPGATLVVTRIESDRVVVEMADAAESTLGAGADLTHPSPAS